MPVEFLSDEQVAAYGKLTGVTVDVIKVEEPLQIPGRQFAMLGYRFSTRFADLPDQRYWCAPLPDALAAGVELAAEQAAIAGCG